MCALKTCLLFMCVCVCLCGCALSVIDKLSVVLLNLSGRILMLISMVNIPETLDRKLIKPLSIIYTKPAFGLKHTKLKDCM